MVLFCFSLMMLTLLKSAGLFFCSSQIVSPILSTFLIPSTARCSRLTWQLGIFLKGLGNVEKTRPGCHVCSWLWGEMAFRSSQWTELGNSFNNHEFIMIPLIDTQSNSIGFFLSPFLIPYLYLFSPLVNSLFSQNINIFTHLLNPVI